MDPCWSLIAYVFRKFVYLRNQEASEKIFYLFVYVGCGRKVQLLCMKIELNLVSHSCWRLLKTSFLLLVTGIALYWYYQQENVLGLIPDVHDFLIIVNFKLQLVSICFSCTHGSFSVWKIPALLDRLTPNHFSNTLSLSWHAMGRLHQIIRLKIKKESFCELWFGLSRWLIIFKDIKNALLWSIKFHSTTPDLIGFFNSIIKYERNKEITVVYGTYP